MSKLIRQSVTFKASPHEVYEALMDSRKHAKFTHGGAKISRKVGGEIMAFAIRMREGLAAVETKPWEKELREFCKLGFIEDRDDRLRVGGGERCWPHLVAIVVIGTRRFS